MERINNYAEVRLAETEPDLKVKWQIYGKLLGRLKELQNDEQPDVSFCPELNPDVIVISTDQSLLFEPQNKRASELLQQRCGLGMENGGVRERIRVQPCESQKIIEFLHVAGLKVVC